MEYWKEVEGTNGAIEVSTHGRVKSNLRDGRILKATADSKGYLRLRVTLQGVKKSYKVHRLVAQAFIENPEGKAQVNHIDGNKQNNHVNNLEWVTHKANTQHMLLHGLKKKFPNNLPHKAKRVLCVELDKVFESMCDASKVTGVPQANISKVCRGIRNTAGGYTWKYIDKGEN